MRAWIVGVEDIRPHSLWDIEGQTSRKGVYTHITWQSQRSHRVSFPPHRTFIFALDELGLMVAFLRWCEEAGFVLGDPPCDE
jgi:hypothetical protein